MFAVPPGTGPPPTGPPATLPPGTGLFQYMKAPMEKWTESTFYSATTNKVSIVKNGLSPHFGQLFL